MRKAGSGRPSDKIRYRVIDIDIILDDCKVSTNTISNSDNMAINIEKYLNLGENYEKKRT